MIIIFINYDVAIVNLSTAYDPFYGEFYDLEIKNKILGCELCRLKHLYADIRIQLLKVTRIKSVTRRTQLNLQE